MHSRVCINCWFESDTETGEMREGEQSTREQMRPLVCMSLEDREWSVLTTRVIRTVEM